jgi:hypothetical protein
MKKKPKKKPGRPRKHPIKVKQKDDYNRYHREYRKVRKRDPLPMGKIFTKKDQDDPWRL